MTQCTAIKKNGDPCPKVALEGTEPPACQFHRPKVEREAKEAKAARTPKPRADGHAPICDLGCFPGGWDLLPPDCPSAGCMHGTYFREL